MNDSFIKNSHDKLFRETWSDKTNARSFMENYLPKNILDLTNLDTLEICKDSFVEKDLKEFHSDMLYRADINGSLGYIYLLFEHKSYFEKWIHLQLLEYMIKIWRQDIKNNNPKNLPVIIPLLLYHGKNKWSTDTDFSSLFIDKSKNIKEFLPQFKFVLFDLNSWSDDDIKGSVVTKAVILLYKHIFMPDLIEKLPQVFSLFKDLKESKTGLQYLESLIRYLLSNIDDIEINDLKAIVIDSIDENKGDMIMTIAERLRDEGMQLGIQQGMQQGIQQGINLVLAVFDRFGQNNNTKKSASMIKNIYNPQTLNHLEKKLENSNSIEEFNEIVSKALNV